MVERLGWAGSWTLAWGSVALVNAVAISRRPVGDGEMAVRLAHHAYDLGLLLAMGAVTTAITTAWRRWGPGARAWAALALGLAAVAIGVVVLTPDFANLAERRDQPWLKWLLAVVGSSAFPVAYLVGSWAGRRRWTRWGALPVSGAAAVVNHLILAADYPGLHLALVTTGAMVTAAAWVDADLPRGLAHARDRVPRRVGLAAQVAMAVVAAAALVLWPPSRVLVQVWTTDGSVLVPFLAKLRAEGDVLEPATTRVPSRWKQREPRPDVPASAPPLVPERPLIVLITLDAVRGEVLTLERHRERLPHLARLSDESVHFRVARAPGSSTRSGLAQVFSGKYPTQLRWGRKRGLGKQLADDPTPRLPELLSEAGFHTIHLTGYAGVSGRGRITGHFDEERVLRPATEGQKFALASETLDVALELLARKLERPTFLYMHWMDAHDPYDAAGTDGSVEERWFREVQRTDAEIGRLRRELADRGLADRTTLVITADHGEGLGDHGIPHHGQALYESLVRVPLLVSVPGVRPRVVDDPVTLMDLGPTILDLASLTTPGHWMGQSLVPYLRGRSPTLDRPIAADAGTARSIIVGTTKVIDDRRKKVIEIYDLAQDPAEAKNLVGTIAQADEVALVAELRSFFAAIRRVDGDDEAPDD